MAIDKPSLTPSKGRPQEQKKCVCVQVTNSTGNATVTPPMNCHEFMIANDDAAATLTATVTLANSGGTLVFSIIHSQFVDERIPEYTSIAITSTGAWRAFCRTWGVE